MCGFLFVIFFPRLGSAYQGTRKLFLWSVPELYVDDKARAYHKLSVTHPTSKLKGDKGRVVGASQKHRSLP